MVPAISDTTHILVIDDDIRLQDSLRVFLAPNGYEVSALFDGRNIEDSLRMLSPDIVLLDVMFPEEDGFSILRRIRAVTHVPVVMISARGDGFDKAFGLDQGADDYISKPFIPQELLARIRAVLRRVPKGQPGEARLAKYTKKLLTTGSITLDHERQMIVRLERKKDLSPAEFSLFYTFMVNVNQVLSRDELLSQAFGSDYCVNDRNIDVHISRLRKILRELGDEEIRIRTVWGRGYAWASEG
jgi:DNA-binding response OmpR family regulator